MLIQRRTLTRTLFTMSLACTVSAFAADNAETMPTHQHNKAVMEGKSHQESAATKKEKEKVKATHEHNKVVMPGQSHEKQEGSQPSKTLSPTHQHNKVNMPNGEHSGH